MRNFDLLDAAKGGPFYYRHAGQVWLAPNPTALPTEHVLFLLQERVVPGMPLYGVAYWKIDALFEAWAAHYDLPSLEHAQRLVYIVDRYRASLEYDLRALGGGTDLGQMWRERRWATLLMIVDRLPRHSYYAEAVANDPEHAEMLIKALAEQEASGESAGPTGPPLHTWTPEVELLTGAIDAIRHLEYALVAVNHSGKGPKPQPPEGLPRPKSMLAEARKSAEYSRRKAKHVALAARMLPHKRESAEQRD